MVDSSVTRRTLLAGLVAASVGLAGGRAVSAPVRRLTLVRPMTGEVAYDVPFWRHDAPFDDGLAELDWLMRDVQAGEVKPIDLRVYYLLAIVQADFQGRPIMVTSGYRTKATNDRLRQQGIDAARRSFHLVGRAADIRVDGVPAAHLAALGSLLRLGGVGIYATYIHLDTGPQRFWRG